MPGEIDLATALNMFKEGAQRLALSRALNNANDQVNQIRASEANEADKRAQLQQVANGLTMHMAAMGTPATTMQAVSGAIAPPKFSNPNEMYSYGMSTGNQDLQNMAGQFQSFAEKPEMDKLAMQLKANSWFKQMIMGEKQNEFNIKQFGDFSKNLDATAASSRSAFGMGGQTLQRAGRINALMGDPSQWQNMNKTDATLVAEGMANLVKGGVATEQELHALVPKTGGTIESDVAQFLTNKPQSAQLQAFMQKYHDILDRESTENKFQLQNTVLKRATGNMKLASRDPDQFKMTVAKNLSDYGIPTNPEDVILSPNGVTTTQVQRVSQATDQYSQLAKKAASALSSPNADDRAHAQQIFQGMGLDPTLPMSQNLKILEGRVRRGELAF